MSSWRWFAKTPDYNDQNAIAAGIKEWNHCIGILEQQLIHTGAWAAGETFTLADVVLGLSVNRWKMTPPPPKYQLLTRGLRA